MKIRIPRPQPQYDEYTISTGKAWWLKVPVEPGYERQAPNYLVIGCTDEGEWKEPPVAVYALNAQQAVAVAANPDRKYYVSVRMYRKMFVMPIGTNRSDRATQPTGWYFDVEKLAF